MAFHQTPKIILGTAQFGLDYGVSNTAGQVAVSDVRAILNLAADHGISMLDTAAAYGNSEECLGKVGTAKFGLVSKLTGTPEQLSQSGAVRRQFEQSLKRLKCVNLRGYLVHDPALLLDPISGDQIFQQLTELRSAGLVEKIGASVYTPDEARILSERYDLDLIQLPVNPLDGRWSEVGPELKQKGVEIHCRSIFLQGLLLMPLAAVPKHMNRHEPILAAWHQGCADAGITPLQACVEFVKTTTFIDFSVLGVTTKAELAQIIEAFDLQQLHNKITFPHTCDETFLNPSLWAR